MFMDIDLLCLVILTIVEFIYPTKSSYVFIVFVCLFFFNFFLPLGLCPILPVVCLSVFLSFFFCSLVWLTQMRGVGGVVDLADCNPVSQLGTGHVVEND